jgi:hypothetical protein
MGFFTRKTRWSAIEFMLIKVCLVSGGIAFGIWLYHWLQPFAPWFFLFYLATGLIFLIRWLDKLRNEKPAP